MTVLCLMGPTACGKTDVALELVSRFPQCELISVDSAMVYRGLNIGTAKPTPDILTKFPHRLIDIRDPTETYSAADFCSDAIGAITDILSQGRVPLLVGGTMLYFRSLQQGLSPLPQANQTIRDGLNAEAETAGWPALHARLTAIDPKAAEKIHAHDSQRIQRALEVYELTGSPLSDLQDKSAKPDFEFVNLILMPASRATLHERIEQRFHAMLNQGFMEEVKALFARGDLDLSYSAIRAVGYQQAWRYLQEEYSYDCFEAKAIAATRQLAKRQITWLRSWESPHTFETHHSLSDLVKQLSLFLIQSGTF